MQTSSATMMTAVHDLSLDSPERETQPYLSKVVRNRLAHHVAYQTFFPATFFLKWVTFS